MSTTAKELSTTEVFQLLDHITGMPDRQNIFLWGPPGRGKTESIAGYASARGMEFAYCAVAQLEEIGDLAGLPEIENGLTVFRRPSWLPADHGKPGIWLLDDFNRGQPQVISSLMQLILMGQFMSWKLPDNWTIVCTGNPDNSDYSTTVMDDAVLTRFLHVRVRFDRMAWAQWAIENNLPSECINFVLTYPELIEKGKLTNARTISRFFRLIERLTPWSGHTGLIETIGLGLLDEMTVVSFFRFLKEASHLIPSPERILFDTDSAKLVKEMSALLVHKEGIRLDLFSTMFNRLLIYCMNPVTKKVNTENLVNLFTLKDIPNDYRTHMYIEFGNVKQSELADVLMDKRVSDALLKAS